MDPSLPIASTPSVRPATLSELDARRDATTGAAGAARAARPDKPVVELGPANRWELVDVRELWRYRELLFFLTWRDVKVRYKQTLLGVAWAVLQPALMMVVFTVFFGRLAKVPSGELPYPLFAYLGLLPWMLFATAVTSAGNSVVGSERLITKVYFPRLAIPLASAGAAVVDFAIAFVLLVGLMLFYGVAPGMTVIVTPLLIAAILLTSIGVGTFLAALNVRYRDFRYVMPFLVQLWMFATPSVYMDAKAAAGDGGGFVSAVLTLNPMTGLIAGFRAACIGEPIAWQSVTLSIAAGVVIFCLGLLCFRRCERGFADII